MKKDSIISPFSDYEAPDCVPVTINESLLICTSIGDATIEDFDDETVIPFM